MISVRNNKIITVKMMKTHKVMSDHNGQIFVTHTHTHTHKPTISSQPIGRAKVAMSKFDNKLPYYF